MGYQQIQYVRDYDEQYIKRMWAVRISNVNNRAKRLGLAGRITVEGWLAIYHRFDGRCAVCGSNEYISIDHILPLSKGGDNTEDNLQPLCRDCNLSKRDQLEVPPPWWLNL